MKSPFLYLAFAIALSSTAFSQREPKINFDLRSVHPETQVVSDLTRNQFDGATDSVRHPASAAAADLERKVFKLLNAERRARGLQSLEWNNEVAGVARLHSQNMADKGFFSHRGSDGSMVDDRADRMGLGGWKMIGENIAYMKGYDDPASLAVEKWMESTAHRNNLLGPTWKESAVGVAITKDGTYYMTQVFLLRK